MKEAEKQIFRMATFDDGIWEIFLGLFFTLLSTYNITRALLGPVINAVYILSTLFLLVGVVWVAKHRITLPRVGFVKFGENTKRTIRTGSYITWALVIITFGFLILTAKNWITEPAWEGLPRWLTDFDVDLVFALVITAVFVWAGYTLGLPRFYLHGVLLGAGNFISTVLHVYQGVDFQWPLAIGSVIIIAIGGTVLSKFLRAYPINPEEAVNAG